MAGANLEWLSVPDVAERMGLSPSKVRRLVEDRSLAGKRVDGVFLIPAVLISSGEPLRELPGTLTVLIDGGFSEEGALDWLLAPHEALGVSPIEALQAGRKTEVRRLAQALAL